MNRRAQPFSTRFLVVLAVLAAVFLAVALVLDVATDFGASYPVTANVVAGVLGLPLSGVLVALVIEFIVRSQRHQQWGPVYETIGSDVLPYVRHLLDSTEHCLPGRDGEIRALGASAGDAVAAMEPRARDRGGLTFAELSAEAQHHVAETVELLAGFDAEPVLAAYEYLARFFPDLDVLDDPTVKLDMLRLRRAVERNEKKFGASGSALTYTLNLWRSGDGRWDGSRMHHSTGFIAFSVEGLRATLERCAEASAAAQAVEDATWRFALDLAAAIEEPGGGRVLAWLFGSGRAAKQPTAVSTWPATSASGRGLSG